MKTVLVAIEEFSQSSNRPFEILRDAGFNILTNDTGLPLDKNFGAELYAEADYVVAGLETYSSDFFREFPNVKAISRVGVGVDCIDLESARENGVKVFVTSDRPSVAVAELCVANMISLLRHTFKMSNKLKGGIWEPIQGKELRSCTVGIVGMGSIGKEVAKRVRAFGSNVVGYGRTWNQDFASQYDIRRVTISEIFQGSDIITIHLPMSLATNGIIDKQLIDSCKPEALILNTSRGGVIDNQALAASIQNGRIGGAAVDVFDEERDPYPYVELQDVILTPHIGSHTIETRKSMEEMASENLKIYDSLSQTNGIEEVAEKMAYINKHSVT